MCHRLLADTRLRSLLLRIDGDLLKETQAAGCPCGGALHRSDYPRKPRGLEGLDRQWWLRFSLCCGREGCRRRRTPPSVRFLGRRVYVGFLVVLVTGLAHGLTGRRAARIREEVGVSRRTLERWRAWWREVFPRSPFWRGARGRFSPPPRGSELLVALIGHFNAEQPPGMSSLMAFLSPVTVS